MSVLKDIIINSQIVFSVVYYAYHVKMLVINVISVDTKEQEDYAKAVNPSINQYLNLVKAVQVCVAMV